MPHLGDRAQRDQLSLASSKGICALAKHCTELMTQAGVVGGLALHDAQYRFYLWPDQIWTDGLCCIATLQRHAKHGQQ